MVGVFIESMLHWLLNRQSRLFTIIVIIIITIPVDHRHCCVCCFWTLLCWVGEKTGLEVILVCLMRQQTPSWSCHSTTTLLLLIQIYLQSLTRLMPFVIDHMRWLFCWIKDAKLLLKNRLWLLSCFDRRALLGVSASVPIQLLSSELLYFFTVFLVLLLEHFGFIYYKRINILFSWLRD